MRQSNQLEIVQLRALLCVLQIAFGSGFKCNSAVWVANRNIAEKTYTWEVRRLNGTTDTVAGTSNTRTIQTMALSALALDATQPV